MTAPGSRQPELIGRERELETLAAALRADQPLLVLGEAGIGKTALVRAAAAATERSLHEGGGFATLQDLPYLAIRRAIGHASAGDPSLVAADVERAIGPDLLFLDDLHWIDGPSREVAELLLGRISVVFAAREGTVAGDEAIAHLERLGVAIIRLRGLAGAEAMTLARRLQPQGHEERWQRIVAHAGGNPLVIEELSVRGSTSTSLTRAIVGQVEALPPDERRALELLVVAGRPMAAASLGAAARPLVGRGLAVVTDDGLAVRHSLVADAINAEIGGERRVALHASVAEQIEDPAERSRHLQAAGRGPEALAVARAALDGETDPRRRAVLLTVAASVSTAAEATEWRVRAAVELRAIGSAGEAVALLEGPLEGDDDLRAMGTAVLAGCLDHEGRNAEALELLERTKALRPTPGGAAAIELAVVESVVLVNAGRLDEALARTDRAVASYGTAHYRLAGHVAAIQLYAAQTRDLKPLRAAFEAAIEAGDGSAAAGRAMDLCNLTLAHEGGAASFDVAADTARSVERLGYQTRADELRAESAQAAIFAGRLQATVRDVDAMLEVPFGRLSRQRLLYNRALALGLLGRFEDAERTFAEVDALATEDFDGRGAVRWCWSEVAFWGGQPLRALELATSALTFTAYNEAEFVLPTLARAWAEVDLGRAPTPGSVAVPFPCLAGAMPELAGLAAAARGDHTRAVSAFDEAAALWSGFVEYRALICGWAAGEAARRDGRPDAVPRLRGALEGALAMGFEPLAGRVRRSLRLAGERPARAAESRQGGELLTARERDVLRLVELGLTNVEIARRMGLGRPTVARLLSNVMLKAGVDSRAQLAARIDELV